MIKAQVDQGCVQVPEMILAEACRLLTTRTCRCRLPLARPIATLPAALAGYCTMRDFSKRALLLPAHAKLPSRVGQCRIVRTFARDRE